MTRLEPFRGDDAFKPSVVEITEYDRKRLIFTLDHVYGHISALVDRMGWRNELTSYPGHGILTWDQLLDHVGIALKSIERENPEKCPDCGGLRARPEIGPPPNVDRCKSPYHFERKP